MRRLLIALLCLGLSGHSLAAVSYYTSATPEYFNTDPNEACRPAIEANVSFPAGHSLVQPLGDTVSGCSYRARNENGQMYTNGFLVNGLPVYVFQKSCQQGDAGILNWPFGVKNSPTGDVPPASAILPPSPVCQSGCMQERGAVQSCFSFPDEDPLKVYCDWNTTLTGAACSTGDEPTKPELPDPEPDPCQTDPNAQGCSGGGDTGGGDTGGGDTGGGDTGGGDTGGGDTGGGDTGGGDTGGGDTGGGDNGSGGNAASGLGCNETLSCSGDSITCSILNLQKISRCEALENNDFNDQKQGIEDFLSQEKFQPDEDEQINLGNLFKEGTRFLPSSCPPPKTLSLTTNGGRSFQLSFEPLCQLASDLSYLIVAAAAVFYALYVGRAVGGE